MSAAPALAPIEAWFPSNASNREWAILSGRAPQLVATMRRYLLQLTTFLAPRSVEVADTTLRQLARWLTTETEVAVVNEITRGHVEDYKVWLAAQLGQKGQLLAKNTQRHRLRTIRTFLERLIEWDWPDAPGRNPILHGDIPPRSEPIPRFLTDQQAAAFMAAARIHPVARYRLVAQVLARTGLRASELCELAADSVTRIGTDGYWLRVPVGKLRNDRMIPLHPEVVDLFAEWTATNSEHIRRSRRLLADHHDPIDRRTVHRIIARIGAIAGIDDMHPHRLRHTLATQAINRGMRLEAIAALLGHRSLEMTLVYAKITDRVVADEYASVCEQIDAPLRHRQHARRPTRGDRDRGHDPAAPGIPRPHARQRHVHPPRRTRLPHGDHLRDLRLLRDRPPVRARPPPPTRPRTRPPPDQPGQALRLAHHHPEATPS